MAERQKVAIYYDGECPFCTRYADFLKLKARYDVQLINAREGGAPAGFNLDEGMLVATENTTYHGAAAMQALAEMSEDEGCARKLYKRVFSSAGRARVIYPFLKAGRNLTLTILGRRKINASKP